MGLFLTISPSYIASRDLSENALGHPGSDTNCWNRTADTWHARQVARTHGAPIQAVEPRHTRPNAQQRTLGLLGQHSLIKQYKPYLLLHNT
jgi:hypothetical protein